MGLAQLFTAVSPEVTAEFEVPYISKLAEHFQMVYYGCCDRLDDRLDIIERFQMSKKFPAVPGATGKPSLRGCARTSLCPTNPLRLFLAGDTMDYDVIAADIRRTCNAAKANGVALEMILKDVSTVRYQPERLTNWADCVMKVALDY